MGQAGDSYQGEGRTSGREYEVEMNKAKLNYWIDVGIGVAGLISALSGLVFLLPGDVTSGILGVSYKTWSAVHTWSSLAAIIGVGAHLVLHWKWMVAMTKRMLASTSSREARQSAIGPAYGGAERRPLSRRAFLAFGGAVAAAGLAVAAGLKATLGADTAEASQSAEQLATTQQSSGVACPFGVVNDPYPGRCRHYRDSNGDGFCDYSVEGSGSNLSTGDERGFGESFSNHRAGSWRQ